MKTVALLFDEVRNRYQQVLLRNARDLAASRQIKLLEPQYAEGSSWNQLEAIDGTLRLAPPPDAMLVLLAGEQHTGGWLERAIAKHVATVFLNRVPSWLDTWRIKHPKALLAAVAPAQQAVGQLQAVQALKLVRPGGFVILMTGSSKSPTALARQRGFMDYVKGQLGVCQLDGRWSIQDAENALTEWFKVGAERARHVDLVVCHNDPMAIGVHRALSRQARSLNRPEFASIPLIGCDGLEDEGQAWVREGTLTATVVLPATTPAALDLLQRYWTNGARAETIQLDVESFPPLVKLRPR